MFEELFGRQMAKRVQKEMRARTRDSNVYNVRSDIVRNSYSVIFKRTWPLKRFLFIRYVVGKYFSKQQTKFKTSEHP